MHEEKMVWARVTVYKNFNVLKKLQLCIIIYCLVYEKKMVQASVVILPRLDDNTVLRVCCAG